MKPERKQMNYINRLAKERQQVQAQLEAIRREIVSLQTYYLSDKFTGPDRDYAHVRTDVLPRLANLYKLTFED